MSGLNRCQFIGHLGADPEMRFTASGCAVTALNLACTRIFSNAEGRRQEETEWVSVTTWNKQAEICNQYLTRGAQVYVEGRLHSSSWDGQDGQKHYRTEVIASRVLFLNKKDGAQTPDDAEPDEIPF
jgi:single-strand DNA-binding protein